MLDFQEKNKVTDVDNIIFTKLLDKIAENPDLVSHNIEEVSLTSIKSASEKALKYWRRFLNCNKNSINENFGKSGNKSNQFKEKNHGETEESKYYSSNYNNRRTNWRNEQRERKSFETRNVHSFPKQRSSDKNEICNWRLECKDS